MKVTEAELAALLERYTCAMADHNQRMTALIDALINDQDLPVADLVAAERQAQKDLVAARKELMRAISGA